MNLFMATLFFLVCAKAFYRKQPLLGYICEVLNIGERDLQNPGLFSNRRVQQDLRDAIYGKKSISKLYYA